MGVKPAQGEILDQALVSYIEYVRAGFEDQGAFDRLYGADPPTPQLEQWDLNREMTFRIAWKPYMYNPTLPHLLGGVRARALVVWGRGDKVVPLECGEAYAQAHPAEPPLRGREVPAISWTWSSPRRSPSSSASSPPDREAGRARAARF